MTTGTLPTQLSETSQEGIIQFLRQAASLVNNRWNIREHMRMIDLAYMREQDWTHEQQAAKQFNAYGDPSKLQNFPIPVIMPAVEAAVTYQASVFLSKYPIFPVNASPQYEDAARQMSSVVDDQCVRGGWVREITVALRDAFKYNLGALECDWDRQMVPKFETDISFSTTQARPVDTLWEGNLVNRWDLYNTFFDSRVAPNKVHMQGEFAGNIKLLSRLALKDFINKLPTKIIGNIPKAFESGIGFGGAAGGGTEGIESYFIPQLNPAALINKNQWGQMDWWSWAGIAGSKNSQETYHNSYYLTKLYARIIPSDFNIRGPAQNTPQVWKFYIVNNQVIIYAERLTNAHNFMPVVFFQAQDDGLEYQTKSTADNLVPVQAVSTALMNSVIASRRRAISDRGIYDPSRVTEANINSAVPNAKIPVRPAAYGKPLSEAYYPIPFRDEDSMQIMSQIQQLGNFGMLIAGQNPVRLGQGIKGNKTVPEYKDLQSNATGRDQLTAQHLECQLFTPLKIIIKTNILQYQQPTQIFNPKTKAVVKIDPVQLRTAILEFKISDGLIPQEEMLGTDVLQTGLQVIGSSPQIGGSYNIGPMFSYLLKTQGADISPFEKPPEQVAFEQAQAQYQQLVMEAVKAKATPEQIAAIKPPQPQDFGYVPNPQNQPQTGGTQGGPAANQPPGGNG